MEFSNPLLIKYRNDRRKLLQFLFSSGLIKEIITPAGGAAASISNINFDYISTDYVIECVKSDGVVDVSKAMERYSDESSHPIAIHLKGGDTFYLQSHPDSAGSPPRRAPPPITMNLSESYNSERSNHISGEISRLHTQDKTINCQANAASNISHLHETYTVIELPKLKTGLLDDDLRESAYEVFLACVIFSGVEIYSTEVRKREKSAKFFAGLKNRRDKRNIESESPERHLKVLDTVRLQMQISEVTDTFVRRRLSQFFSRKSCGQIDVPQLALVLLTPTLRSEFPNEKSYVHWKNRQANVLEELVSSDHKKTEKHMTAASLEKIRNPEKWDTKMSSSEHSDVLLTMRQVTLAFSSMPGRFGMEGETYYWSSGYHLNIRLYEKLLLSVFDILEDGQLIEEAEDVLKLVKLTWSMLGITEQLHHALFAWVLFQQFVATKEAVLMDYAIREVERVLSSEVCDDKEVAYMRSLVCYITSNGVQKRLSILESIFLSIRSWCDGKLQDYHLHFSQTTAFFERVVTLGLSTEIQNFVSHGNIQLAGSSCLPSDFVTGKIRTYVEKSLDAACNRVIELTTARSIKDNIHPLAILASELRLIADKDLSIFSPVLRLWYPDCAMISTITLHQFYGERLKPFLKDVIHLTEDVRKVLPAAYALERCLIELYSLACPDNKSQFARELKLYPIAEVSRSIILDWVVAQHEKILEWTGRAFDLEDWEPLSSQKKQAASAVEVFRIIEETVDQFFEWGLPVDITHLQALLSIIFHSLDAYLLKVVNQSVDKNNLYPSVPPLTRYKEAAFPIIKRKVVERLILDNEMYKLLDELTPSKLCIRLNTYRYIQKQTAVLEEGIRNSWKSVTSCHMDRYSEKTPDTLDTSMDLNDESISELFVATLHCIKDSAAHAIIKTSEFLGAKIVFWDLRDAFLLYLYHGGVEGNRMDGVFPKFDSVLNRVCGLIDNTIRDLVVLSIWKASLEGFMWVLLDGGPSRAFSDADITIIEEDLNMLKDLFVADGEGLPRSLVEEEAKYAHQIINLFSLQTATLIQRLMESSEHISVGVSSYKNGRRHVGDAQTLIRVLCHKKDKEASKFLKKHYNLPPSSEYDETAAEDSSFSSPPVADIWKRSESFRWSEKVTAASILSRRNFKQHGT